MTPSVFLVALVVFATVACQAREASVPPAELLGVWQSTGTGMPGPCREATVEFRRDGAVVIRSGPQVLSGTYTAVSAGSRLLITQSDVRANGHPNCQGISADSVLAHYMETFYVAFGGDTLEVYVGLEDSIPFFEATRLLPKPL